MTIIAEDGSGLADAESYCDVTFADTYHSNRANTAWALLTTAIKEANLRKATDYMLGQYRMRWLGRRVTITQALDWPRVGVVIEDLTGGAGVASYGLFQLSFTIVPVEVKNACAELALRSSASALIIDQTQKVIQETVGPVTVKYDSNAPQQIQYSQIDAMLRVYLTAGGNMAMVKLIRT